MIALMTRTVKTLVMRAMYTMVILKALSMALIMLKETIVMNYILVSGHYNHLESIEKPNPYDTRKGRTAHTPKQRPVHSSSYTPYDHYGHNNLLISGHNVPEIGPEEVYSDYETHEYW